MKPELQVLLDREDYAALAALAQTKASAVLRHLSGRLYSADESEKWRAVRALEHVAPVLTEEKATELLRRFFWALNDESGAVPYGIPEAIGAILAARPELRPQFLPILQSMLTEEDVVQTGSIADGVRWALNHLGV